MSDDTGSQKDPNDEYDSKHGDPAKGKDHKCVDLSDSANKAPDHKVSFNVSKEHSNG